jgi:hypothetical protein
MGPKEYIDYWMQADGVHSTEFNFGTVLEFEDLPDGMNEASLRTEFNFQMRELERAGRVVRHKNKRMTWFTWRSESLNDGVICEVTVHRERDG